MPRSPATHIGVLLFAICMALAMPPTAQAEQFEVGGRSFELDPLFARYRSPINHKRYVLVGTPLYDFKTPLPELLRATTGLDLGDNDGVESPEGALDANFIDWRKLAAGATDATGRYGVGFKLSPRTDVGLLELRGDADETLQVFYFRMRDAVPDLFFACQEKGDAGFPRCDATGIWKPGINYRIHFEGTISDWRKIDEDVRAFLSAASVD